MARVASATDTGWLSYCAVMRRFWEAGGVLYVPPAMWEHAHMNDNPNPIEQLRIAFGIRTWFTDIWPEGYTNTRIYDDAGRPIEAGKIIRERQRSY